MVFLYMLTLVIMVGCVPAHFRANPQLQERVQPIKTVAIVPLSVKVYQLAVGSDRQLMNDSTAAATQNVAIAIEKELSRHSVFVFTPFPSPTAILAISNDLAAAGLKDELEDTQALFDAVSASVLLHTYEPKVRDAPDQTFPEKLKNFDYSLGPGVQRLAKLANADALLFISGVERVPTTGQVAGSIVGTVLGSLAMAALTMGHIGVHVPTGSSTTLSVALVDATTGAVLWYNVFFRPEIYGHYLAIPQRAADMVEWVFKDFPGSGRPTRNE